MKLGYSKTFPNLANGQWVKVWAEEDDFTGTIEEARKTWYAIKKEIENFYYESTKVDEKKKEVPVVPERFKEGSMEIEEEAIKYMTISLEDQIKSCKELKVLESYKFIIKGKPELETAYSKRLKELT